jgi:hypothetical protein
MSHPRDHPLCHWYEPCWSHPHQQKMFSGKQFQCKPKKKMFLRLTNTQWKSINISKKCFQLKTFYVKKKEKRSHNI